MDYLSTNLTSLILNSANLRQLMRGFGVLGFWGADTAKVCSNVGMVVVDGPFECSFAVAAT